MENFIPGIAELLEVDNVEMNDEFTSFECWDSMTILSIIAFVDENYSVALSAADINKSKTVGGLIELIEDRM
jgi:acyl carrier protein